MLLIISFRKIVVKFSTLYTFSKNVIEIYKKLNIECHLKCEFMNLQFCYFFKAKSMNVTND